MNAHDELGILCDSLASKESGFFLIETDSFELQKEIIKHLSAKLTIINKKYIEVDISDWNADIGLSVFIKERHKNEINKSKVLFLYNLGAKLSGDDHFKNLLLRLNYSREPLNDMQKDIVFFVTPYAFRFFQLYAPDLYDWITQKYFFKDERKLKSLLDSFQSIQKPMQSLDSDPYYKADNNYISLLEKQLNDAKKNKYDYDLTVRNILEPLLLAKATADKEEHENKLYQEVTSYYEKNDVHRLSYVFDRLATIYKIKGRYSEAEPLLKRTLDILEKALPEGHPDIATSLNNLAGLYDSQGRYVEAEPLFLRALEMYEKALPEGHPSIATSLNNLAGLYASQGRYSEAEPLYKRALEILEKALPEGHPNIATSLNNLAGLYRSPGRYSDAEPLYKRALSIREKALPEGHPNIANSLNNLALLYHSQGRYVDAEPLYKRALEICEKAFPYDHPHLALVYSNYAKLLKSMNDIEGAAKYEVKARVIWEKRGRIIKS